MFISLSSNGHTIAIGAPYNDDNGFSSGEVRVYEYNGTIWTQVGQDINGEQAGDQCGIGVSISHSGNILAVSSKNGGVGIEPGHVRIYMKILMEIGYKLDKILLEKMIMMNLAILYH